MVQAVDRPHTLMIMAAGIGSRFGGIKQMFPIGDDGELIIDYSVYDALAAGFGRVVFILKREIEADFRETRGRIFERRCDVEYAFQSLDDLPSGWSVPDGRTRPWGTVHAVMSARGVMDGPFAVINADDYYGPSAFVQMAEWLSSRRSGSIMRHAMAAYLIENTLSDCGGVTRGICKVGADSRLVSVTECRGIERSDGRAVCRTPDGIRAIPDGTPVSMNFWGLDERFIDAASEHFPRFLSEHSASGLATCEYLLPDEIDRELKAGAAEVDVMMTDEVWYGVTYRDDVPTIRAALGAMHASGAYPTPLWRR